MTGGRTAIYVKKSIPHYQIPLPPNPTIEATGVVLQTRYGDVLAVSAYHPLVVLPEPK